MIKINDYATKNHLNEWEIKDLPEGDYRLDLPNGDLSILFYLTGMNILCKSKIFIPSLPNNNTAINNICNLFGGVVCPRIYTLDNSSYTKTGVVQNITPDWSKYIAEGNAVLFLSEEEGKKYSRAMGLNWFYWLNKDSIDGRLNWNLWINKYPIDRHFRTENTFFDFKKAEARLKEYYNLLKESKKISIILPSIHSQNIQEISNRAKDLKENYGVEYVEIIATHCYLKENKFVKYDYTGGYKGEASFRYNNIDKIITTDSTGALEVQDCANFKVIDCKEFFNNFLQNDNI